MEKKFHIEEVNNSHIWEEFNQKFEYPAFFQSWDWGEVVKKDGVIVLRLGVYCQKKLCGIAQLIEVRAKRGHFIHIRQGPVMSSWTDDSFGILIDHIVFLARKSGASFIRMSPMRVSDESLAIHSRLKFVKSPVHNQDAENRWILDLDKSQEEILKDMRKTTRYMIRRGQSEALKIICSQNSRDVDIFLKLYKETANIKHFVAHKLVKEEFETFKNGSGARVYMVYRGSDVLSGAIIVDYAKEAIYHHGATSSLGRGTPASYLLQWQSIIDAKERGLKTYNFWGIARDENDTSHPWHGLTLFKKGFGGRRLDFQHSVDIPLSRLYWLTYLVDFATTWRKGYL